MENLIGVLIGIIVVLIIGLWWLNKKLNIIKANHERTRQEIQKEIQTINYNSEVIKGKIKQFNAVDLDFSVIENQIEENTQQLGSFIRQEIGGLDTDLKYLAERVDELEEKLESLEEEDLEKISKIEEKLEEIEDKEDTSEI